MIYKKFDDNTYHKFGMVIGFDNQSNLYKVIRIWDGVGYGMRFKTEQLTQNWIDWYIEMYREVTSLDS